MLIMFYNDNLDATFLHIPKCGGVYVRNILTNYYGFNPICSSIHEKHYDFVEDDNHYNNDKDIYYHSIRTKGKYRYLLTHQDSNPNKFKNSFKFTFVRNPYEKLLSAYKYLERTWHKNQTENKAHNTLENYEYLINFNEFVKNYKNVINISYSHAFITQYDHLCDFSGNINFNYIGKTETLDDDLVNILFLLCIKDQIHLSKNIQKINKTNYENPIYEEYNEDSFKFVNEWFKIDFETFNYEMFNSFEQFKEYYISKKEKKQSLDIKNIYKEIPLEILPKEQNIEETKLIPRRIMQTFSTNTVDNQIYNNIMNFLDKNKEYSYHFVTDKIGRDLIEKHFDKKTLYAFDKLPIGSLKADFIRYIYLYLYGGIYLDIHSSIITELNTLIQKDDEYIFIVDSNKYINKWFIAIKPKHLIMKQIIEKMVKQILQNVTNILLSSGMKLFTSVLYNYFTNIEIYDIGLKNDENNFIVNEIINKNKLGQIIDEKTYLNFLLKHFKLYNIKTNTNKCLLCKNIFNNDISYYSHKKYCTKNKRY